MSKQIVSEDSIGFMLGQTYRKIVYLLSSRLKEFDITTEQFSLLYQLDKQDGINQKELAHRTSKDQPTTTRILDALYKKGLIHKKTSENDRRAFLLFLTDAGKEMVKQTLPIEQQTIQEALHNISDADLAFMKQLLQQMSENAQKQIES
ncbi:MULTISPECIES: MarR family winged helix-turn-helix transcriptional regulator [Brevibacillus]|uniref:MarR family winged helix-turn-helix transcriptional regulator n=1 Tax=Brevibacillus TaxID=55080 RepID=UPI000377F21D|nr:MULTISPECIES: MarR family transcriptional regulator [Brevibacillus]ATO48037.1 transcriptional regulator [Brevibacillus laterosporus DSM 25]AYB37194.1 MarR family transcriptional regulator [Brevibacillus laterosporus]MBG9773620.1 transcriptional regulator [Brevibacillus laterosporus]MBG9788183.1 transcriptional regulator [Brevibacillus laterosporus]MBG9796189.1 transcriptional regulator [Brevibacillus laterosporus]